MDLHTCAISLKSTSYAGYMLSSEIFEKLWSTVKHWVLKQYLDLNGFGYSNPMGFIPKQYQSVLKTYHMFRCGLRM